MGNYDSLRAGPRRGGECTVSVYTWEIISQYLYSWEMMVVSGHGPTEGESTVSVFTLEMEIISQYLYSWEMMVVSGHGLTEGESTVSVYLGNYITVSV